MGKKKTWTEFSRQLTVSLAHGYCEWRRHGNGTNQLRGTADKPEKEAVSEPQADNRARKVAEMPHTYPEGGLLLRAGLLLIEIRFAQENCRLAGM